MKKSVTGLLLIMAAASLMLFSSAGFAALTSTPGSTRDLNKLKVNVMMLNQDAGLPVAQKIIRKQLADTYSVMSSKVDSLFSKNITYGDAAAVLAFAMHMPGGTTDANITRVLDLQKVGLGWDRIATSLSVPTSIVADSLATFENNVHMGIKEALVASPVYGEAAGGVGMPGTQTVPGEGMGGLGTSGQPSGAEIPGSGGYGGTGGTGY